MRALRGLIVNADDYGLCDGVDRGIREAASAGIVTSVSVMADRVTKDAIARLLDVAPTVGLGLHADLTSDLRRFLPGDEAARVRAQAERFFDRVGRGPDHVNAHKHLHRGAPQVLEALASLGVPVRADRADVRRRLRRRGVACADHFVGDVGPATFWTAARLRHEIALLPPGTTEMMCHPGYADGLPAALTYRDQRIAELHALTSPRLRERLAARRIDLTNFSALRRRAATPCG